MFIFFINFNLFHWYLIFGGCKWFHVNEEQLINTGVYTGVLERQKNCGRSLHFFNLNRLFSTFIIIIILILNYNSFYFLIYSHYFYYFLLFLLFNLLLHFKIYLIHFCAFKSFLITKSLF